MESTIADLKIRKAGHRCTPVVIGGAVVTEEYARQIGANGLRRQRSWRGCGW